MAVLTAPAHSTVWLLPERWEVRQAIRENGPLNQSVNLLKKVIFTTEKFTRLLGGLCQISPSYRQQSFDYSVVKQEYLLLLWLQDYRSSSMGRQLNSKHPWPTGHRSSASLRLPEASICYRWPPSLSVSNRKSCWFLKTSTVPRSCVLLFMEQGQAGNLPWFDTVLLDYFLWTDEPNVPVPLVVCVWIPCDCQSLLISVLAHL